MTRHPRPVLLVDATQSTFAATTRAVQRLGDWRPLLPVPQWELARQYLTDAVRAGRPPALIILRVVENDAAAFAIHDWVRKQPEPLREVPILMISDSVVDEAQTALDIWIERAMRTLLEGPDGGDQSAATVYPLRWP